MTLDLTQAIQARDGVAVVIYTKDDCMQCDRTKKLLDRESIVYTTVNAEHDEAAYKYVTETLGLRQMPVVVASTPDGDEIWSGLRVDLIKQHITHRQDAA